MNQHIPDAWMLAYFLALVQISGQDDLSFFNHDKLTRCTGMPSMLGQWNAREQNQVLRHVMDLYTRILQCVRIAVAMAFLIIHSRRFYTTVILSALVGKRVKKFAVAEQDIRRAETGKFDEDFADDIDPLI